MHRGLALGVAGLLAILVLRDFAGATADPDSHGLLAGLAGSDRRMLGRAAESALGREAASGAEVGAAAAYRRVAVHDPLADGPLVYAGAVAERRGDHDRARTLFKAAVARDPRARAPHYFLAIDAMRRGDDLAAIDEFAALNAVRASARLGQTLADYLVAGGKVTAVERFLAQRPALRPQVLMGLASHADRLDILLSLARPDTPSPEGANWRGRMLSTLLAAGRVDEAVRAWPRLTGTRAPVEPGPIDFAPGRNPLPFEWAFPSRDAGLVSVQANGVADILYYGRDAAVLATRDLLMPPGRYRLSAEAKPVSSGSGLEWQWSCLGRPAPLARAPIAGGTNALDVDISADCRAQRLTLRGVPGDSEREAEWLVSSVRLERRP